MDATSPSAILFVGAGRMGGAIIEGFQARGSTETSLTIVDPFLNEQDGGERFPGAIRRSHELSQ